MDTSQRGMCGLFFASFCWVMGPALKSLSARVSSLLQRRRHLSSLCGGSRPSLGGGCFSPPLGSSLTLCEPCSFSISLCFPFPYHHHKPTTTSAANQPPPPPPQTNHHLLAPERNPCDGFGPRSLLSSSPPLCGLRLVLNEPHRPDLTGGFHVRDQSQATLRLTAPCPVASHGNVSISLPLTTSPDSPIWKRPPPEPPPRHRSEPALAMTEIPPSDAVPIRPPPKPTWFDSVFVCGALGWFFFVAFGLIKYSGWSHQFWGHVVSVDAADLDLPSLVSSCSKFSAGTLVALNTFSFLSYRQVAFTLVIWLDHRETTHSRNVLIPGKEMIRKWIDSKTVDSPPILATYEGRMLFARLLGLAICFDVGPMWLAFYLCIAINELYVLTSRSNSITRLGYVPTPFDHPECIVFSQLMK